MENRHEEIKDTIQQSILNVSQHVEMPLVVPSNTSKLKSSDKVHISDLLRQSLTDKKIVVANHCYGCTAGQGSSCGGSLESV